MREGEIQYNFRNEEHRQKIIESIRNITIASKSKRRDITTWYQLMYFVIDDVGIYISMGAFNNIIKSVEGLRDDCVKEFGLAVHKHKDTQSDLEDTVSRTMEEKKGKEGKIQYNYRNAKHREKIVESIRNIIKAPKWKTWDINTWTRLMNFVIDDTGIYISIGSFNKIVKEVEGLRDDCARGLEIKVHNIKDTQGAFEGAVNDLSGKDEGIII